MVHIYSIDVMIATTKLINTFLTSHGYHFRVCVGGGHLNLLP